MLDQLFRSILDIGYFDLGLITISLTLVSLVCMSVGFKLLGWAVGVWIPFLVYVLATPSFNPLTAPTDEQYPSAPFPVYGAIDPMKSYAPIFSGTQLTKSNFTLSPESQPAGFVTQENAKIPLGISKNILLAGPNGPTISLMNSRPVLIYDAHCRDGKYAGIRGWILYQGKLTTKTVSIYYPFAAYEPVAKCSLVQGVPSQLNTSQLYIQADNWFQQNKKQLSEHESYLSIDNPATVTFAKSGYLLKATKPDRSGMLIMAF